MSTKCIVSALLLFIMFPILASAQKDYVVTEKGDTLYGKMRKKFFAELTFVSQGQEYLIDKTLKSYYINKDSASYYKLRRPEANDEVFMYAVEKGEISLYTYTIFSPTYNGGTISKTNWYIEKAGTPLSLVKSSSAFAGGKKDRKELLESLIADKPEILKLYKENDSFTFNNIRELINEYNKLPALTNSSQ